MYMKYRYTTQPANSFVFPTHQNLNTTILIRGRNKIKINSTTERFFLKKKDEIIYDLQCGEEN